MQVSRRAILYGSLILVIISAANLLCHEIPQYSDFGCTRATIVRIGHHRSPNTINALPKLGHPIRQMMCPKRKDSQTTLYPSSVFADQVFGVEKDLVGHHTSPKLPISRTYIHIDLKFADKVNKRKLVYNFSRVSRGG